MSFVRILDHHMKKYLRKSLSTVLFVFIGYCSLAQSGANDLRSYMEEVRKGSYKAVPQELMDNQNEDEMIATLQPYLSDSVERIRAKAYYVIKRTGQKSTSPDVRQTAVSILVQGINDQNSGISGNASEALTSFRKEDFSDEDKAAIGQLLRIETPHLDQVLKLAGYLGTDSFKPNMNQIIGSNAPFKFKWAARVAMARMGDAAAIDYIMGKLNAAPVNDALIYDIVPDLVYTRQMEIFKYLEQIINSDEPACQSADPDSNENILCGYRVMEYIAPAIESYPLPVDEFGYLEIDDYEAGLKEVRVWLMNNPDYTIRKDEF